MPPAMKKGTASSKKSKNTKSGSEEKSKPKKCLKNVKEQQKKTIQSSYSIPVAGTSHQSNLGEIPSKQTKKRGKKANVPVPEDNTDSEEKTQERKEKENNAEEENKEVESISSDSESEQDPTPHHNKDLDHLRRVDPEFYDFLLEHDVDLLKFDDHNNVLDVNGDDDDDDKDEVIIVGEQEPLGPGDEGDAETQAVQLSDCTLETVQQLQIELQESHIKLSTIQNTLNLMATSRAGLPEPDVFIAVLDMCVVHVPGAIEKYLGFETSRKNTRYPPDSPKFYKIKRSLIEYLSGLLDLLVQLSSDSILTSMLKHLHQLCKYVACFPIISKKAIKNLLPLWSHGMKTVRIQSFSCIIRITRNQEQTLLVPVLKAMFWTYIRNCKFVSPMTWPNINFMRRSLVEMLKLDVDRSHLLVVLYVRQLGIHLKKAVFDPKEDHILAVFNWQFMNALHLWAEVVSQTVHHTGMKSLHFPLVMIISNSIKLGPTPQYYPLRFYLIQILMKMQEATGVFITIMPFFMDVIKKFNINKKHKTVSKEPLDFSCIIRLSKSQMKESGFKDAVVERLHALLLEYTASLSYKMIFPECCTGLILFFRDLVEKCENSSHKKQLKQLFNKILENNEAIFKLRQTFKGDMVYLAPIQAWEEKIKEDGTPLLKYYGSWKTANKPASKVSGPGNPKKKGVTKSVNA